MSAFSHVFINPWLWCALGFSLLLQVAVVNLGFLNTAFGTEPLSWSQWLTCLGMARAVLWFSELRKLVLRVRIRNITPGWKTSMAPLVPR